MSTEPIFHGPAHVEIQGPKVLHLEHEPEQTADHVEFQLIGFEETSVIIKDYRKTSLEALMEVLSTQKYNLFAPRFNQPAEVTLWSSGAGEVHIELQETKEKSPAYMLWIAIGMDQDLPVYNYVYRDIAPMENDKYALLSLYKRPRRRQPSPKILTNIV